MISIVLPVYNEEKNIETAVKVLDGILTNAKISYELIFANDGSSDNSWKILERLCKDSKNIQAINFSKNFGKEAAIFAGLEAVQGDCAVVMDCDLQHPPATILEMYTLWESGDYDVVEGIKSSRGKESAIYKGFSMLFYKLLHGSSGINLKNASDFKLLDRKVVDILNQLPERQTFFRALSSWVGFRKTQVFFEVAPRNEGKSKWSFTTLFNFALNSISSFSSLPMQVVTICGFVFFVFALIMSVDTLYKKIAGLSADGFTTVILLLLIIGSIIMFSLGIIGYYLARIYEEIKNRPRYIISRHIHSENTDTD